MKGLYYTYITLKKHFLIWAAVIFVIVTVLGCVSIKLAANPDTDPVLTDMLTGVAIPFVVVLGPMLSTLMLSEGINRDIEENLKCGFLNYALSGMSYHRYTLTQLFISLLCLGVSIVMIALHWLFFCLADSSAPELGIISLQLTFLLLGCAINWLCIPLTLKFRSQEKAGMLVGLTIGLGIAPFITTTMYDTESSFNLISWFEKPVSIAVSFAGAAVLFALGYLFLYKTVKRGDL